MSASRCLRSTTCRERRTRNACKLLCSVHVLLRATCYLRLTTYCLLRSAGYAQLTTRCSLVACVRRTAHGRLPHGVRIAVCRLHVRFGVLRIALFDARRASRWLSRASCDVLLHITAHYVRNTAHCLCRTACDVLLTAHYTLLVTHYLLRAAYYVRLTAYYVRRTTYHVLLTARYLLRDKCCLLRTTY